MESNESVPVAELSSEVTTSSEVEDTSPPRPIVTKPPEVSYDNPTISHLMKLIEM